ncbi:AtpZ/AtpI family protein [Sphingomonas aerolata]|uniref:AtpZ/AtpI family protein n=1 Tax=Sphingomonas aerolata TaxID=185951 RepID=UPI002FE19620
MAEIEPGQDPYGVEDPRLSALDERLREVKARETLKKGREDQMPSGVTRRAIGSSPLLIEDLVGSALIGWLIDHWVGTGPWGLIVLLFLGIAVAFRQIIRISGERPE